MDKPDSLRSIYETKDSIYFQHQRPEMLQYIPKEAHKILDVGCANGAFGKRLKETRVVEVWGIELNESAAKVAAENLDNVICAAFDANLNLPIHAFDCIVFNDVLEHLIDPFSALFHAKNLLRKGGVVVSSIPNIRAFNTMWDLLVNKNWQYADYGILDRTHLRFFTRRSILSTFDDLGYQVERLEGIFPISSRKLCLLNWLFFNQLEDMRYEQFAVVARPIGENKV